MLPNPGATARSGSRSDRALTYPIYAVFAANGFLIATWVSRLPAVQDRLDASEPQLGVVLLCLALGALLTMPATGWLCDRFGVRRVILTGLTSCAGAFVLAGAAPTLPLLGAALVVAGASYGMWDVAMNAAAHAVEVRVDQPLMPRFHGMFSVGGLVGAGLGAAAAAVGLALPLHAALAGTTALAVGVLASRHLLEPPRHEVSTEPVGTTVRPRRIRWRLVALGLLTACATLGEGAAADWGALFLHDERGASESTAAIGFAVFSCAMAVGRFGGTWALAQISRVAALRVSGLVIAASLALLVSVDLIPASLVAMAGWGLGVAIVFPAAMSAAAEHSSRPAHGIAMVATIGYGGFLVGPPLIGFLAGAVGLGEALWVVGVLGVVLVMLAPAATSARRVRGSEADRTVPLAPIA